MSIETEPGDLLLLDFDWGRPEWFGCAAYWADQTRRRDACASYAVGTTLVEELAVCLLGGHGIPAEIGLAAYRRVRDAGLLADGVLPTPRAIRFCLFEPLAVQGRWVRYRFPLQRSTRLAHAIRQLRSMQIHPHARQLRDTLMELPGVGPKTASWIVRNYLGSPAVAIIDIHVHRAGEAAGFFDPGWTLPRDYFLLERAFLGFAKAAQVPAPQLDACIWEQMRELGRFQSAVLDSVTTGRLFRERAVTNSHGNQVLNWPVTGRDINQAAGSHNARS